MLSHNLDVILTLLQEYHDSVVRSQSRFLRMNKRIVRDVY